MIVDSSTHSLWSQIINVTTREQNNCMGGPLYIHTDSYEKNCTVMRGRMWKLQQLGEDLNKPVTGITRGHY